MHLSLENVNNYSNKIISSLIKVIIYPSKSLNINVENSVLSTMVSKLKHSF